MRWLAPLVLLAGCNWLFGLDGTSDRDRDGDRVPDTVDNCPDQYNPDQSDLNHDGVGDRCDKQCIDTTGTDTDGDGIPDGCDACNNLDPDTNHNGVPDSCEHLDAGVPSDAHVDAPIGITTAHDEDRDGVPDSTDKCPSVFDNQTDTDNDGVGDACDLPGGVDWQMFDGFAGRDLLSFQLGKGWKIGADRAAVTLDGGEQTIVGGIATGEFRLTTHMAVTGSYPTSAGVFARTTVAGSVNQTVVACDVQVGQLTTFLVARVENAGGAPVTQSASFVPTGAFTLSLYYNAQPAVGNAQLQCTAIPDGNTTAVAVNGVQVPAVTSWYPAIGGTTKATAAATFDYLDVVTNVP